ncbi:hypothetical protein [Parafilimonas sp.]|uniref:hypothetical protein n=1 Tax=Parafilimonas sp. TaxID=1969739 RepID=UPI0039E6F9B2
MIEAQSINGKNVWLKVDPYKPHRDNPNIIPTEYFTISYFLQQPTADAANGETIKEENGDVKLFESPVEAISYAVKVLQNVKSFKQ